MQFLKKDWFKNLAYLATGVIILGSIVMSMTSHADTPAPGCLIYSDAEIFVASAFPEMPELDWDTRFDAVYSEGSATAEDALKRFRDRSSAREIAIRRPDAAPKDMHHWTFEQFVESIACI